MTNNTQSRKQMLTINNPKDHGFDHEKIVSAAGLFNPDYFCFADEIGESERYHTHIFIYLMMNNLKRYTMKNVNDKKYDVPIWCKTNLTINEAAAYSNIGINKISDMLKSRNCPFALYVGNKKLVKRVAFEEYLKNKIYI